MQEKLKWLYRKEIRPDYDYFFLVGVVFIFSLLRIPSLVEPDWYGDEGIYQVIGVALNHGRLLYRDIWDNKPPMLYLYYAAVNGDLFYIRLLSLLFGIGAVVTFFFLARILFEKKRIPVFLSTACFAILFGIPILEGNIANAENFILFPVLLSLFFILKIKSRKNILFPVLSGLLLSIAFLTKIVAVFDLAAFLTILFIFRSINKSGKQIGTVLRQELYLIAAFVAPILCSLLFFFSQGALADYIKAAFAENIGYVGYGNYFLIPQGLLIIKLLILCLVIGLIFLMRKRIGVSTAVVYIWLSFSVFSALFSGRPYTHYALLTIAPFCLTIGLLLSKKKMFIINLVILIVVLGIFKLNFQYYKKTIPYYKNYLDFVFDGKSVVSYQTFFDSNTPQNYDIAGFITMNTKKDESVFILSDSSTIYYLAGKLPPGRYIVEYHIAAYKDGIVETKKALSLSHPKYILSNKENLLSNFIEGYVRVSSIDGINIYERQY